MRNPAIPFPRSLWILAALILPALAHAAIFRTVEEVRARIDRIESQSLERLLESSEQARALYERSVAYAVFDATKVAFGITGGGGTGVAVDRATGARVYMHMGTGGLSLGLGGQNYQVIFLFADEVTYHRFVTSGWEAAASANAVAGRAGVNANASFVNGMATYQFTGAGLMLQADLSGTKYWKSRKLNSSPK